MICFVAVLLKDIFEQGNFIHGQDLQAVCAATGSSMATASLPDTFKAFPPAFTSSAIAVLNAAVSSHYARYPFQPDS